MILTGCESSSPTGPLPQESIVRINYKVPENSYVKLTVENSYNTIVATPVDGIKNAGYYSVSINFSNFNSGVYFYTLEVRSLNSKNYREVTYAMLMVKQ